MESKKMIVDIQYLINEHYSDKEPLNESQQKSKKVFNDYCEQIKKDLDKLTKYEAIIEELESEEMVEDEPEEKCIDEMTYEQALDIILSQVDLVESEENKMCKVALEEAIERLRKYENNKIGDELENGK